MQRLETLEFRNGLSDLVTKRAEALGTVTYGPQFLSTARGLIVAFDGLPEAFTRMPLAELLDRLDTDHDRWGVGIDHVVKAIEEGPEAVAGLRPVAELVRSRYMTKRSEVTAAYAVEDQRGRDRLATLEGDKAVLDRVTGPDGRPLSAWINDYAAAGTKLGDGLTGRADTLASTTASPEARTVQALRTDTMRFVSKLRAQVRTDLEHNPALPRTLEGDVLGYIDELTRLAEARAKTPKKPKDT